MESDVSDPEAVATGLGTGPAPMPKPMLGRSQLSHEPVLFLDFDGVLHPFGEAKDKLFCAIPLLEEVLREFPSTDVVISSSWREVYSLDLIRDFFSPDIGQRIIDAAPVRPPNREIPTELWSYVREGECVVWMRRHRRRASWLALDDDAWRFRPFSQHLMLVDGSLGLTADVVPELRARLKALQV